MTEDHTPPSASNGAPFTTTGFVEDRFSSIQRAPALLVLPLDVEPFMLPGCTSDIRAWTLLTVGSRSWT